MFLSVGREEKEDEDEEHKVFKRTSSSSKSVSETSIGNTRNRPATSSNNPNM